MAVQRSFDYIVIGAGSAGCVVAGRLSQDADRSVLLLEAGGWDSLPQIHDVKVTSTGALCMPDLGPGVDRGYLTEPGRSLDGRRIPLTRAGSSAAAARSTR
jgi:choline dehydrogenase-like flavoprotein